jgi:RNA polymerase sigma-70 factor (ECF subfamily)
MEENMRKLLLMSLQGDQEAYQIFLHLVAKMVRAYLMKKTGSKERSPERVEDLVQEVLLGIHLKKASYRQDLPVLPWLYAIARHRLIDDVRAGARQPVKVQWDVDFINSVADQREGAEEAMGVHHEAEAMLAQLGEQQREVLYLAKVEGLPLKEIAERTKMSLASVKVTIHRAIKSLRKKNEGSDHEAN